MDVELRVKFGRVCGVMAGVVCGRFESESVGCGMGGESGVGELWVRMAKL